MEQKEPPNNKAFRYKNDCITCQIPNNSILLISFESKTCRFALNFA